MISSTNRENSKTFNLSLKLCALAKEKNMEVTLISLVDFNSDFIHKEMYEEHSIPASLVQHQDNYLIPAKKIVFIIPEYNGSFPGILKLWIDILCMRKAKASFESKNVGLIGLSDGRSGNLRGLDQFILIARYLKMIIFPSYVTIPHIEKVLSEWNNDSEIKKRISKFLNDFNAL
ncbi:MAG: NAD(P)H-dependent oxidoreductase [Bacteroidota bacterium]|nr:NAD(P)H-dependent oxidoreductase [Bacteroidota bacterium]